ncbi:hypothetical protein EYF80_040868 [Liparis tanakae]|uniref:Uncharacterized protein n=1 Tax=Liparis tanakae TaxID=230148 RepID=A0A4Z2G731_9TELE|nr:hypothetical protein EYF80_040868 [Liparis tanakae]
MTLSHTATACLTVLATLGRREEGGWGGGEEGGWGGGGEGRVVVYNQELCSKIKGIIFRWYPIKEANRAWGDSNLGFIRTPDLQPVRASEERRHADQKRPNGGGGGGFGQRWKVSYLKVEEAAVDEQQQHDVLVEDEAPAALPDHRHVLHDQHDVTNSPFTPIGEGGGRGVKTEHRTVPWAQLLGQRRALQYQSMTLVERAAEKPSTLKLISVAVQRARPAMTGNRDRFTHSPGEGGSNSTMP